MLTLLFQARFYNQNMSSSVATPSLILFVFVCPFIIGYDIIIYKATPAGIAAAVTAARTSASLSIAIIEPTPYVGGMASAGGIGLSDCQLHDVCKFLFALMDIFLNFVLMHLSEWFCCTRMGIK